MIKNVTGNLEQKKKKKKVKKKKKKKKKKKDWHIYKRNRKKNKSILEAIYLL